MKESKKLKGDLFYISVVSPIWNGITLRLLLKIKTSQMYYNIDFKFCIGEIKIQTNLILDIINT